MLLKTFEYFASMSIRNPKVFVTSSEIISITQSKRGYVYNYVKLKIYNYNNVEIIAHYLTPGTLKVVMDETFKGKISTVDDENGLCLFVN